MNIFEYNKNKQLGTVSIKTLDKTVFLIKRKWDSDNYGKEIDPEAQIINSSFLQQLYDSKEDLETKLSALNVLITDVTEALNSIE